MSRTRAKAHSGSGATAVKPRPPSDPASAEPGRRSGNGAEASVFRFKGIDAAILALVLGFAILLIANTGFANGQELWPMPDAVEYAAIAVNLDRGLGPVLHFGGNSYPARYTIGYPLMLAAAYPLLGRRPERLCIVTALTALIAIAGLYILTLWAFGRPSAVCAGLLLATSPHFLGLSTCVMSDVPSLAVAVLAALAFLYAEEKESLVASALCGLLAGLAVTIRVDQRRDFGRDAGGGNPRPATQIAVGAGDGVRDRIHRISRIAGLGESALPRFAALERLRVLVAGGLRAQFSRPLSCGSCLRPGIRPIGTEILSLMPSQCLVSTACSASLIWVWSSEPYFTRATPSTRFQWRSSQGWACGSPSAGRTTQPRCAQCIWAWAFLRAVAYLPPLFLSRPSLHATGVVYRFCRGGLRAGQRESKA